MQKNRVLYEIAGCEPRPSVYYARQQQMRIFVALDLDPEMRVRIARFIEEMRALAPDVRWVSAESLHITLKFIGEKPDQLTPKIEERLRSVLANSFELSFRGCGFFPTPRSARVFWIGIEAAPALAELASAIDSALSSLPIPKEERAFSPHLTLARAGSGAPSRKRGDKPNQRFSALQEKLAQAAAPDFGTMAAREFFMYRSQLSSQGPRYSKIARFPLSVREP
jgi:RNA 2',3'-cyclic 3'-phosphodiesterase